ncbi:uncharacterized protein DFL_000641 [Arthrobotrys flagrans]|uniref:Uncharacterized protein n=1 Tax=Arthrobotrys flagrans TaxID=97331 RepID=A0A437AEH0_ARTFL|nr:hypothetical protein DFL_000641 [Arthrobotrys flagrans]
MYDKAKGFALIFNGEDLDKKLSDYPEPVRSTAEVNDSAITEFLEDYSKQNLDFNSTGGAKTSELTTNSEATSFEARAKDPRNRSQGLVELTTDLLAAIKTVFSAFSTLQANYGFLGAEYEDVDFEQITAEVDEDIVVESSPVLVRASVKLGTTSPLDPDGDMFKSRELPKVLPLGGRASP